jgi:hypothetical protein
LIEFRSERQLGFNIYQKVHVPIETPYSFTRDVMFCVTSLVRYCNPGISFQ